MARRRDPQRKKLYAAEDATFPRGVEFSSVRAAQTRANELTNLPVWRALGLPRFVLISPSKREDGASWTDIEANRIHLSKQSMNEAVILHELTHIAMAELEDDSLDDHGPEYVHLLRRLVEDMHGDEIRAAFDLELEARGVKWHPSTRIKTALADL